MMNSDRNTFIITPILYLQKHICMHFFFLFLIFEKVLGIFGPKYTRKEKLCPQHAH